VWSRRVRHVLLAALLAGPCAQAQDALQAIDSCLARLDPVADVGYERIAARCPDLTRTLTSSGWSEWLPASWREPGNDLSAGSLEELRAIVTRELASERVGPQPRVERLHEVLAELDTSRERGGLWERFRNWLRSLFEASDDPEGPGWFARLIERMGVSQAVIEIITYVGLALAVGLTLLILVNELRLLRDSRRRSTTRRAEEAATPAARGPVTWADIERVPLVERPGLALRLLADRLTSAQRLPPAASLTVRELVRTARLDDPDDRRLLLGLSQVCERVRYSPEPVEAAPLEEAVRDARTLYERIGVREAHA